ncbi:MAG: CDP-diacylglycerol--glycerol-3-phosphate 3-phosphatidyltransferase [Thermoanaerobaculia bacterium]
MPELGAGPGGSGDAAELVDGAPSFEAENPLAITLPTVLTLLRILLVPILVVVLLTKFEGKEFVGLALFLIAALTDFLDGYIARRKGLVTRLGKLLDPAADKILMSAALISLVELGLAPAWMVVTIVAREFAISTLRSVAASHDVVIAAAWSGKIKTASQVVAISLLIMYERLGRFEDLGTLALWVTLILAVYSGIEYAWRYAAQVRRSGETDPAAP